jgi:PIN domain nuclease of toxin-antitoxin system
MLDTHVAVALYEGRRAGLSKRALGAIDREPASLSPAVVLELELLHEIGRLRHGGAAVCEELGRRLSIPVATDRFADVVAEALSLPFTRDPFDRLIVAHAALQRAALVTLDENLHRHYGRSLR